MVALTVPPPNIPETTLPRSLPIHDRLYSTILSLPQLVPILLILVHVCNNTDDNGR